MGGRIELSRARTWINSGPPRSGTSAGTGRDDAEPGDILTDKTNGVVYINEGSKASPYWTPIGYDQAGLFGVHNDFRDTVGKALADTAAGVILAGSGLRVFGQGVEVNGDSGLVVQAAAEGGYVARIHATNETDHLIAIGMAAGVMQPDQHGQLVIDVELTNVSAITLRAMFLGFIGTAADALDPAITWATTVATFVQADIAGLAFSVDLTDGDRIFAVHDKSAAAGTQDLTAIGDTAVDIAAAGTYQRLRVEIFADGDFTAFIDKLEVYTTAIGVDVDEELSPCLYLETTSDVTKVAELRRISMWANR